MTEGTSAPLATWQDVADRWRPLTTAQQTTATTRILEASALLRMAIPDIDERAAADPNLAVLVVARVADAVKRTLINPEQAKQVQETIGPRSYGLTFDTGGATGIFFTDDELAALEPKPAQVPTGPVGLGFGTATVGIAAGWGPPARPRSGGWW